MQGWPARLALCAILTACGGGGSSDPEPPAAGPRLTAAHAPLATGYRWSYRDEYDALGTEAVVASRAGSEGQHFTLQAYIGSDTIVAGALELLPDRVRYLPTGSDSLDTAIGAYDMLRFPMVPGDRYSAVDSAFDHDVDGDGRTDRVRVAIVVELLAVGPHEIPLGRFDDVAQVRTTIDLRVDFAGAPVVEQRLTTTEWRAPGVGILQRDRRLTSEGFYPVVTSDKLVAWRSAAGRSDSVAPTLVSAAPVGTRAPRADVRLAFSEIMDPLALRLASIELRRVHDASVVPGRREAGPTTLSWRQDDMLPPGEYEARLVGGVLTDLAGNAVEVPAWRFRIDALAQPVAATTPAPGATEVPLDQVLQITLDELPDPASLTSAVWLADDRNQGVAVDVTLDGKVLTVRPQQPLARGIRYTLWIDSRLSDRDHHAIFPQGMSLDFYTDAGRFRYPQALPMQAHKNEFQLGDADGDGRLDIVFRTYDSGLILLRNLGGLQFERSTLVPNTMACESRVATASQFLLHDLDGDRRPELVRLAPDCGIEVLARASDGSWPRRAWLPVADAALMRVADVDGDGRSELLVVAGAAVQVWALEADGSVAMRESVDFPVDPNGLGWITTQDVAAPDLDGDRRPDLMVVRAGTVEHGAGVQWRTRLADGRFGAVQCLCMTLSPGPDGAVVVADLDADGRQDLAIASPYHVEAEIAVFRQAPGGGLGAREGVPTSRRVHELIAVDLDGDGRPELVTGYPDSGRFGVHTGLGPELDFPALRWLGGLVAGDLDGDGLVDLVTGNAVLIQKR